MVNSDIAYKYSIPLDKTGGVSSPVYDVSGNGEVLAVDILANSACIVCTKAIPHFHKDSVNVEVEEVKKSKYT